MIRSLSRRLTTKRDKQDGNRNVSTSPKRHRRRSSVAALDTVDENRNVQPEPPEWVMREYQAANVPIPSLPPSASFTSGYAPDMLQPAPATAPPVLEVMKIAPPTPELTSGGIPIPPTPGSPPKQGSGLSKSFSIKRSFSRKVGVGRGHGRRGSNGMTEMMLGLGDQIKTIDMPSRRKSEDLSMGIISGARTAGSYTWLQGGSDGKAAIAVPGMPDKWSPPRSGPIGQLRPSKQAPRLPEMMDYNSIVFPLAPLEPIFHALTPDALDGVSLMTDRSNLRKLHLFCSPQNPENEISVDFRFDSEMVDGIVRWTRWESASRRKQQVMGLSYAPSLIDAVTARSPGVNVEGGTMGLVRYRLGGLEVLARFEVDAALDVSSKKLDHEHPDEPSRGSSPSLVVKPHYRPHPSQDDYLDIKVVSAGTDLDLTTAYIGMIYAQVPRMCIAEHSKGNFGRPEILELNGSELRAIARDQEAITAKVAYLAGKIVEATKKYERMAVVCRDGAVRLHKLGGSRMTGSP